MSIESPSRTSELPTEGGVRHHHGGIREPLIELDEDLFPWVESGEVIDDEDAVAAVAQDLWSETSTGPAWRRIEQHRERQQLRRLIEDDLVESRQGSHCDV